MPRTSNRGSGLGPGSRGGAWPETPWDLIRRGRSASDGDRKAARDAVISLYYGPIRRFIARALRVPEDRAADIAHDLMSRLLERDLLAGIAEEKSLRAYMKVACRRQYMAWLEREELRRALPIDGSSPSGTETPPALAAPDGVAAGAALDEEPRAEYVRAALEATRAHLLRRRRESTLAVFEARVRFDGARPEEYPRIAARLGLTVYDVRNRLFAARKVFRRELLRIARDWADDPESELAELGLLRYAR